MPTSYARPAFRRPRHHKVAAFSLASLLSLSSLAAHALEPYKAEYRFSVDNAVSGLATRELRRQGDLWRYDFSSAIPVIGRASETSQFRIDNNGNVQSSQYNQAFRLLTNTRTIQLRFDSAGQRIYAQKNKENTVYPYQTGAVDQLNLEVQVREDLIRRRKLASAYFLAGTNGIESIQMVSEGTSRVQTPAGTFDALVVRRIHSNPKRQTRFWLAPALNYLPVRVQQNDNGTLYTINLNRLLRS